MSSPTEVSAVLALPYIQSAQAQKHVPHNEAIRTLDVIVQLAVADRTLTAAPPAPALGERYIVGAGALGEWAGQDGRIAVYDLEGWVFMTPLPGWRAEVLAEGASVVFNGSAWVLAGVPASVDRLGVNATADATNRLAVSSDAVLLNHAGADHQLKINKATPAATASLLFQTGFSGRAEMGLAGNDDFSIKVSADGVAFAEGLRLAASGAASLPGGAILPDGLAATPGLRFAADPDTGISRPGANQLGLVAGGALRAQVSATALQVDVPVTGSAVQATSHEATVGRLLRLATEGGSFGWGVAAGGSLGAVVADANAVAASGLYRTDATSLNLPQAAAGLLEVFHGFGGGAVLQRWAAAAGGSAARQWLRRMDGTAWSGWTEVLSQGNLLGTVSQSAGLPTGAAMETGTTAAGRFLRLADGTQICTSAGVTVANASTATGSLFRSANATWTFPAAFVAAPVVTAEVDDSDAWGVAGTPSATSVTIRAVSAVTKGSTLAIRALAIGRWF